MYILSLQPDVLVLYTGHNEFGNAVFTGRYGNAGSTHIALLRAVLRSSRLFQSFEVMIRGKETLTLPSETNEKQYSVDSNTRDEIYWRYEERLRHIVSKANDQGATVVLATLMSNPVAPSMEFSCPDAMRRAGFPALRPEALPVEQLRKEDIAAAETMNPGCRDLQWLRARQSGDKAQLDMLRDSDPLPVRADRPLNEIIRRVAADTGVILVDVDSLARQAGGGLEPLSWFIDSNHLTIEGHDALARMVGQAVAPVLGLPPPDAPPGPTTNGSLAGCGDEACRERRAFRPELELDFGQFNQ